jgi:hypothetical protein
MKNSGTESKSENTATERESKKKTIVAPVNIVSAPSEALEFAVELAQRWEANLYVMYVYSALPRVSGARFYWERHQLSVDL